MKTKLQKLGIGLLFSGVVLSANAADERIHFGWGSQNGGDLTMFSKNHDTPNAGRAGELAFIYGGGASTAGDVTFLRYNGSTWDEMMSLDQSGVLRIGASRVTACGTGCKLAVNGTLVATEVKVATVANWPDYVFESDYNLRPLDAVEEFIKTRGHLPDMPSAKEIESNGVSLGGMNAKLLQKIEELTLYLIDIKKENAELRQAVAELTNK
jgi:hypothetical protein